MSEELRIVLSGDAKAAHDKMLSEIRSDGLTSINSSKMINWIVCDYFNRFFRKRKPQLAKEHFNPRKCVVEAMKTGDPEAFRKALRAAAKSLPSKEARTTDEERAGSPAVDSEKKID